MTVETAVFRFAGIMIMLSVALTFWVHANFVWLTLFVGVNLFQYSFSNFCPAATVFKWLGLKTEAQTAKN